MEQMAYFKRRVLEEWPYLLLEWCEETVRHPEAKEVQADGRIRHGRFVPELGKHLRVVTVPDGVTLHNAFPDCSFKPDLP